MYYYVLLKLFLNIIGRKRAFYDITLFALNVCFLLSVALGLLFVVTSIVSEKTQKENSLDKSIEEKWSSKLYRSYFFR
jgi:hypothetical protein